MFSFIAWSSHFPSHRLFLFPARFFLFSLDDILSILLVLAYLHARVWKTKKVIFANNDVNACTSSMYQSKDPKSYKQGLILETLVPD